MTSPSPTLLALAFEVGALRDVTVPLVTALTISSRVLKVPRKPSNDTFWESPTGALWENTTWKGETFIEKRKKIADSKKMPPEALRAFRLANLARGRATLAAQKAEYLRDQAKATKAAPGVSLTSPQLATLLNIHLQTLQRAVKARLVLPENPGGPRFTFSPAVVNDLLERQKEIVAGGINTIPQICAKAEFPIREGYRLARDLRLTRIREYFLVPTSRYPRLSHALFSDKTSLLLLREIATVQKMAREAAVMKKATTPTTSPCG